MADFYERVDRIEARLDAIEQRLGLAPAASDGVQPRASAPADKGGPPAQATTAANRGFALSTASFMALGAAASFVLAGAYFVMLAYDAGWLTPLRQIVVAFATGTALIAGGQWLAGRDREYAAYLPAVGLTILYFAVYAGHLVYGLIPVPIAIALIGAVSATGLAVGWRFDNSVFAILAAASVYLTPLLIRADFTDLVVIVIYFSVWSLMFSFFALQEGRRATYLVAMYLAMTAFDASWRLSGGTQWALAATYQLAQFSIFASTAALFSVRHRTAMSAMTALLHGIPLIYFYGLEYFILKAHAPLLVAPAGLGSVACVIAIFLLARRRFTDPAVLRASATLVSAYCAFVTAHILFFELLPAEYFVWGAMVLPVALVIARRQLGWGDHVILPLAVVGGVLFVCGFVVALLGLSELPRVQFPNSALLLYSVVLYAIYFFTRHRTALHQLTTATLYVGHLAVLVTSVRVIESGLTISISWAIFAIALLALALSGKSRELGQSSLVIFSASAFKVLIFDLDGSSPGVRILTLIVLGGSLYLGGWLYQNLVRNTTEYHDDAGVTAAIRMIADLVTRGFDDQRIAAILNRREFRSPAEGGWDAHLVSTLRQQHEL